MKYLPLLLLLSFVMQVQAQNPSPRRNLSLDSDWRFSFGHAADPAKDFNFSLVSIFAKSGKSEGTAIDPKFDDNTWRLLDLPHDWAVELPFIYSPDFDVQSHGYRPVGRLYPETSIGWYRKHFSIHEADSGKRFTLRFDGIFRDAQCWMNGFYLGRNESGYLGVTWDITDYLNFHGDNVVAVRVDATQYEGWFYEGAGIYRHVWLTMTDPVHIAENGIFISSDIRDPETIIQIETTVDNQGLESSECTVTVFISTREGLLVAQSDDSPMNLEPMISGRVRQDLTLMNPSLWSPENPYLYRATVIVQAGGKVTDSMQIRFGVRSIAFDPEKGFVLNGKHLKLYGVNNHQDHAGVGSALPDFLQYYRIRLLKDIGVNAYRTSHNAPTPELLDACDSLGMLVLDEQRLLNSSPEYLGQFERLILRDRNHPSVFLWSIGNEEGWAQTNSYGKRIALTLVEKQYQLDPTRTSTYAADLPNHYTGINEVIPVRSFNYRQFAVAEYHRDHPHQPILGTEMGSTVTTRGIYEKDTVSCYLPDQDITAPWWASTAETWWTLCAEQPWWAGGFVWTGFDYRGEPTPFRWPNINSHFGILDMCGFRKNISWYYESWWSVKDVLHLSPHWNWQGKEGQPIDVWINSNTERVELFLNGKSLGEKEMPRNSHLKWSVPYHPGKLEAIGYRDGRKISSTVETTGEPVSVVIVPDKTTLKAGIRDGVVCNIHVVDAAGHEVPDASNLIRFTVKGDCRILGVGNGDPSSHEPDLCPDGNWRRKLFSGKCQIILQAGNMPGTVILKAESEGLRNGEVSVQVTK